MSEDEHIEALLAQLQHATVRLVELSPGDELPSRCASGFVVQRRNRWFVVTVAHSISEGPWHLELDAVRDGEAAGLLVPLSSRWVVTHQILLPDEAATAVDFAWAELDLERVRADAVRLSGLEPGSVNFIEYRGPLDGRPDPDEPYAFCALNQPLGLPRRDGRYWLERRPAFEYDMTYVPDEDRESAYAFRLARPHQGRKYYAGSSGAPIADQSGKIISVVLGGNEGENLIWGAKLADCAELIGTDLGS